jgi:hypothetical protein
LRRGKDRTGKERKGKFWPGEGLWFYEGLGSGNCAQELGRSVDFRVFWGHLLRVLGNWDADDDVVDCSHELLALPSRSCCCNFSDFS